MPWIQVLRNELRKNDSWFEALQSKGGQYGIHFDFDGEVGNSMDSLRLVQWSRQHGLQEPLCEELAAGHFEHRRCTCDHQVMLDACAKVGLPVEEARQTLESDNYLAEVMADLEATHRAGFHSIPVFIFDNCYTVHGAASVEEFEQVLRQVEGQG